MMDSISKQQDFKKVSYRPMDSISTQEDFKKVSYRPRMRSFGSFAIAAVVIVFFFLFHHPLIQALPSYCWKTATKENLPLADLYCDRPNTEYIPNSYIVGVIRRNYTFAEHKQAVAYAFDLDVCLSEMQEEPTLGAFTYSATLNARALAAVRAAPYVSSVECNRHFMLPGRLEDTPWIALMNSRCEASEDGTLPKSYHVHLYEGCPLQDHKKKVALKGFDLGAVIKRVHPPSEEQPLLYYTADLDKETLAAVRRDLGVVAVQCQIGMYVIDWWMGTEFDYSTEQDIL